VGGLGPSFPDFAVLAQDPVHGGLAAQVLPLVEQGGPDLCRGLVDEVVMVQYREDVRLFEWAERVGWRGAGRSRPGPGGSASPVVRGAGFAE
jgi:hypothetical protein